MSGNKKQTNIVPGAEAGQRNDDKTTLIDYLDLDSQGDSGIISSGSLLPSDEIFEDYNPHLPHFDTTESDSGIIEDRAMKSNNIFIDSGVYTSSELSLSEKLSKLKVSTTQDDLDNSPMQPVETNIQLVDDPWNIYFEQDEDGDTHLHMAVAHGFVEVSLALIRGAPDRRLLDTQNDASETALHLAVQTGQYKVARWLIVAGARPCPRDSQGNSPLHIAARLGDLDCIKAITNPVNPKHKDIMDLGYPIVSYEKPKLDQWNYLGQTCIHTAARHGHLEALRYLVACGADINAREGLEGMTALHYAVQMCDESMVRYLLTECKTLKPDMTTYGGRNAWQKTISVPDEIKRFFEMRGMDSPFSSEDEDSGSPDEEMTYDLPVSRYTNLVDATA